MLTIFTLGGRTNNLEFSMLLKKILALWNVHLDWMLFSLNSSIHLTEKWPETHKKNIVCIKGAVCKYLTLLKHKNTIICLQIFKKHAKLTYLFIWKKCYSQLFFFENVYSRARMSVLLWFMKPAHCQFTQLYAVFKSSWDIRTYEVTSRYYDVGYVQVTLVRTRWRFNFST